MSASGRGEGEMILRAKASHRDADGSQANSTNFRLSNRHAYLAIVVSLVGNSGLAVSEALAARKLEAELSFMQSSKNVLISGGDATIHARSILFQAGHDILGHYDSGAHIDTGLELCTWRQNEGGSIPFRPFAGIAIAEPCAGANASVAYYRNITREALTAVFNLHHNDNRFAGNDISCQDLKNQISPDLRLSNFSSNLSSVSRRFSILFGYFEGIHGSFSGCPCRDGGASSSQCGPERQANRYEDADQTPVAEIKLIFSDSSSVLGGPSRFNPSTRTHFSSICRAPLLTKIGILSVLGFCAIGFIWAGIGLFLLGDYYRRYHDKLWLPRRPALVGGLFCALGIASYVGFIWLSQHFNRCQQNRPPQGHSTASSESVVQLSGGDHRIDNIAGVLVSTPSLFARNRPVSDISTENPSGVTKARAPL